MVGIFFGRIAFKSTTLSWVIPLVLSAGGILLFIFTKKHLVFLLLLAIAFGMAINAFDALYSQGAMVSGEVEVTCRVKDVQGNRYLLEDLSFDEEKVKGKAYLYAGETFSLGAGAAFFGSSRIRRCR